MIKSIWRAAANGPQTHFLGVFQEIFCLQFSHPSTVVIVVVQSLSRVWLFATPWTTARQAPLSPTSPRDPIESVMLSNSFIFCHPLLLFLPSFPASGSFPMNRLFPSDGQSIGVSATASVLPMIIQGSFPLGLTDLISLLSKRLSRVFSSTTIQKHQFFGA